MRAVLAGCERTPKDVDGHDAAGSVVGSGCCRIRADSRGSRRTRTELVKSQLSSVRRRPKVTVGILAALRVALVAAGFAKLLRVLRREREVAAGKPLSNSERLDHRGVAAVLLGFALLMGYFVAPELYAAKWLVASLLYTAILAIVGGLGLSVASGVTEGLRPGTGQPEAGAPKVARNEPCPCGSGKKFKHCHGARPGAA
jgi:hypothetical protein